MPSLQDRLRPRLAHAILLAGILRSLTAYSIGAPSIACGDMTPGHPATGQTLPGPYSILISKSSYIPFEVVNVTIAASSPLSGFMLQARDADDINSFVGSFQPAIDAKYVCTHAMTHTSGTLKDSLTFIWRAPVSGARRVVFRATIVQDYFTFYIDLRSTILTPRITVPATTTTTTPTTTSFSTTTPTTTMPPSTTTPTPRTSPSTTTPSSTTTTSPSTTTPTTTMLPSTTTPTTSSLPSTSTPSPTTTTSPSTTTPTTTTSPSTTTVTTLPTDSTTSIRTTDTHTPTPLTTTSSTTTSTTSSTPRSSTRSTQPSTNTSPPMSQQTTKMITTSTQTTTTRQITTDSPETYSTGSVTTTGGTTVHTSSVTSPPYDQNADLNRQKDDAMSRDLIVYLPLGLVLAWALVIVVFAVVKQVRSR